VLKNEPTLLLSMGYDSLPAWFALGKPQAVYVSAGVVYSHPEIRRFEELRRRYPEAAERLHLHTSLEWLGRVEIGETSFVPLRNALMTMVVWAMGADDVILAAATDYGPDKRLAFTLALGLAGRIAMGPRGGRHLQGTRGRLRLRRPFLWKTKDEMLRLARAREGSWDWLDLAYACYVGTEPPCGTCRCCRRAMVGLAAAGAPPPHRSLVLPRMSLLETLRFMPNALDFKGTRPTLPELAFLPLRSAMAFRAWRNTR